MYVLRRKLKIRREAESNMALSVSYMFSFETL